MHAAQLDAKEKAWLRGQAREWLQADLVLWTKRTESAKAADRATLRQTLRHWQEDADLASVRDAASLANLAQPEREAWLKIWADVAAELGCAEGTVFSRLARARDRLRKQLQRRGLGGLALAAGGLALTLAQQACVASVPPAVLQATLHTTLCTATLDAAATGASSRPVAALAEGALRSMFITKLQTALALVTTTLLLAGSAYLVHRAPAEPPPIRAEEANAPKAPVARFTDAEFKKLKPVLDLKNQAWTTIPGSTRSPRRDG
jgi:hypothetical protein